MRQALFSSKQSIEQTPMQMSDGHAKAIKFAARCRPTRSMSSTEKLGLLGYSAEFASTMSASACCFYFTFDQHDFLLRPAALLPTHCAHRGKHLSRKMYRNKYKCAPIHRVPCSPGYARSNWIITALAEPQDL